MESVTNQFDKKEVQWSAKRKQFYVTKGHMIFFIFKGIFGIKKCTKCLKVFCAFYINLYKCNIKRRKILNRGI